MSEPTTPSPSIQDELIDRLVDGELSFDERRALLQTLDRTPDGWRRCALAFVEAQVWRATFASSSKSKPAAFDPEFDRLPPPKGNPSKQGWPRAVLRLAALLLAGFGLGVISAGPNSALIRPWLGHGQPPPASVALDPELPLPPGLHTPAKLNKFNPPRAEPHPTPPEARAVGFLKLASASNSTDPDTAVGLPVLAGPGLDENWLRNQPPFLPEHVQKDWESKGYRVDRQRRLISVQVDDQGRYLSIPVDEVKLHFVGGPL